MLICPTSCTSGVSGLLLLGQYLLFGGLLVLAQVFGRASEFLDALAHCTTDLAQAAYAKDDDDNHKENRKLEQSNSWHDCISPLLICQRTNLAGSVGCQ